MFRNAKQRPRLVCMTSPHPPVSRTTYLEEQPLSEPGWTRTQPRRARTQPQRRNPPSSPWCASTRRCSFYQIPSTTDEMRDRIHFGPKKATTARKPFRRLLTSSETEEKHRRECGDFKQNPLGVESEREHRRHRRVRASLVFFQHAPVSSGPAHSLLQLVHLGRILGADRGFLG